MGYITVEKHVFYVKPKEHADATTHLWVRSFRVPMGREPVDKTVKYLDDGQFGGLERSVGGHDPENLKRFFLGKGHPFPKLVVADVRENDFMTQAEIKQFFIQRMKRTMRGFKQGYNPGLEEARQPSFAENMAKYRSEGTAKGSREVSQGYDADMHNPHLGYQHAANIIWLLQDPTKPGRITHNIDEARRLYKRHAYLPSSKTMFSNPRTGDREADPNVRIVLGIAYRLAYYQYRWPPDAISVPSIDARVERYLQKKVPTRGQKRVDAVRTWYVMGRKKMPGLAHRFKRTPQGRRKNYRSFALGRGMAPSRPGDQSREVPLFTVKGRSEVEAKNAAQEKINRMIASPDPKVKEKGYDLETMWWEAGRRLVTVGAMRMLHQQYQL